jgi:hypothetical protein
LAISVASLGVILPVATAFVTAAMRSAASRALVIGGSVNVTGRSLRGGYIRSRQSRIAIQRHLDGFLRQGFRLAVQ